MDTPRVYVLCGQNCKYEGMTKEQILTAIVNAIQTREIGDINTGFVTTIKTVNNQPMKFFLGKQAEYAQLTEDDKQNLFAIITDDTTRENLIAAIEALTTEHTELAEGLRAGSFEVAKATKAEQDSKGNIIHETYVNKAAFTGVISTIGPVDFDLIYYRASLTDEVSNGYFVLHNDFARLGKTLDDVIGISGRAYFKLPAMDGTNYTHSYTFTFTSFCKEYDTESGDITFECNGQYQQQLDGKNAYLFRFTLNILADKRVKVSDPRLYNLFSNDWASVYQVDIKGFTMFFK